jgi:putative flavoprotein involved in K+ transport
MTNAETGSMPDALPQGSIDTVIIGGGQAGLVTGYHLKQRGIDHVILDENDEVGASWRNRWDSLRLFTPAGYSHLPGMEHSTSKHTLLTKDDVADYLVAYAEQFDLPVSTGVPVDRVAADHGRYVIESGGKRMWADNVVVATGAFHTPRVPGFADDLDPNIVQLHSSEYRRPSQIKDGSVLVVGAGQSGVEIALDLCDDHDVWLSGRNPGGPPFRRDSPILRIIEPIGWFMVSRVINVTNPIGRKVRHKFLNPPRGIPRGPGATAELNDSSVVQVERTAGTKEGAPQLKDGTVLDISNVVWSTGFVAAYDWIDLPVCGEYGYPIHDRGVVESQPGFYFMGLPFQRTLSSALIGGMGRDAEHVAAHIHNRRLS